ncbi:UNVERIFIED_CONTAM: hypothetical protein PYX00_009408 [Menopon gallinae]|uniref:CRAL-TRIO domain-containing protein n=1 Tax=Menopon gallinae TaxID=328185 RepID=A0AAW2HAX7_9NEOP
MTHVQKYWVANSFIIRDPNIKEQQVKKLKAWIQNNNHIPNYVTDEQIVLFLHSNYYNIDTTKKCMEDYYKLRLKVPQFFEGRDINSDSLDKALRVLHYGIFPKKTPENYQVVFHKLNNPDPLQYVFNDGFKLLSMMIDAVYAKEGPLPGLLILFDLTDVKIGHITRLPLNSVRKCLEYIQDAIPIRLKGIHVLNVHPIIDKIMMLIKPFLRKGFLSLIHFYKEGNIQDLYKVIPKSCLPSDYGGELESVQYYHEEFITQMRNMRQLFIEEEELMCTKSKKSRSRTCELTLNSLEID